MARYATFTPPAPIVPHRRPWQPPRLHPNDAGLGWVIHKEFGFLHTVRPLKGWRARPLISLPLHLSLTRRGAELWTLRNLLNS